MAATASRQATHVTATGWGVPHLFGQATRVDEAHNQALVAHEPGAGVGRLYDHLHEHAPRRRRPRRAVLERGGRAPNRDLQQYASENPRRARGAHLCPVCQFVSNKEVPQGLKQNFDGNFLI